MVIDPGDVTPGGVSRAGVLGSVAVSEVTPQVPESARPQAHVEAQADEAATSARAIGGVPAVPVEGTRRYSTWLAGVRPVLGPLTVVLALLALMWQQQSGFNSINDRIDTQIADLRSELSAEISDLRAEMRAEIAEIRIELNEIRRILFDVVERLSRIEGFLGLGMSAEAAARAPGAGLAGAAAQASEP